MDRGERERGEGCWLFTEAPPLSDSSPFMRSSLVIRCCFGAGFSDDSESGLRRFRVRRRMICSPLFCLMMFRGLGVYKETETIRNMENRGGSHNKVPNVGGFSSISPLYRAADLTNKGVHKASLLGYDKI